MNWNMLLSKKVLLGPVPQLSELQYLITLINNRINYYKSNRLFFTLICIEYNKRMSLRDTSASLTHPLIQFGLMSFDDLNI